MGYDIFLYDPLPANFLLPQKLDQSIAKLEEILEFEVNEDKEAFDTLNERVLSILQ